MSEHIAAPTDASQQPPSDDAAMTDSQLAEAKRYGHLELACTLADRALDVAYLAVAAFLLARPIDAWLQGHSLLGRSMSLRLAVLFLIVMGLHVAVSFPLSFLSGHVLEHRFGLSRQTFGAWLWRYAKRNVLAVGLMLVLLLGLYWMIWIVGPLWWLVAAAAFFLVTILLGQLAPVLILPLFYRIEKLDAPELTDRLSRLAQGVGLSIEGVYRMDLSAETVKANAMLAGLGRTRRVLLGDTLLSGFKPEEIEVVFAHEVGHHVHRHIRTMIVIGVFYSAAGFWLCDRLLQWWSGGQLDYAKLPIYTLPFLMLVLTLFSMLLEPLQNAVSRRFERQADRYALERTGLKAAYLSAFRKLAKLNKDDPDPHWLDVLLFHTHPPVSERLAMAEKFAEKAR
ncbi:MAG: M48 family metallopeptidase [Planctomycetaceae bacterium]|nr:M48 family metallopeptidase [Planctomycetaceae bacterium]